MVQVNLEAFSEEFFLNYLNYLINQLYKTLCLKEENSLTLTSYIESLQREIVGSKEMILFLKNDARIMSVLSRLQYLSSNKVNQKIFKKEIFYCIKSIQDIKEKYRRLEE